MKTPSQQHQRFLQATLIVVGIGFAIDAAIFMIRMHFTATASHLFNTTGEESVVIYTIWKLQHGFPVYEWPDRGNYALSLYNFLFYYSYAGILSLLGQQDAHILNVGRFITASFALVGILIHWKIVKRFLPRETSVGLRAAALLIVAATWIGRSTTGWWTLSIRADIAALVLELTGFLAVLFAMERARLAPYLAAAAAFYAAWAMKQSMILTLCGCLLILVITRKWKPLLVLAVPFCVACAITLLIGGQIYRRNIIDMPALAPLSVRVGVMIWRQMLALTAPTWCLGLLAILFARFLDRDRGQRHEFKILRLVSIIAFLGGCVFVCKQGASRNHLLEPLMHATTLGVVLIGWIAQQGSDRTRVALRPITIVLLMVGLVTPSITLMFPQGVAGSTWTLVHSAEQIRQQQALVKALRDAPRPLLTDDPMISLPWNSTNNQYPALVIDKGSFEIARAKGVLPNDLFQRMLLNGTYRSALFPKDSDVTRAAISNGFVPRALPDEVGPMSANVVLLERPKTPE